MAPGLLDGSLLGDAHPVFDRGEGLLDRIEIGGIRRQVPEPCASGLDHLSDNGRLVRAEGAEEQAPARLRPPWPLAHPDARSAVVPMALASSSTASSRASKRESATEKVKPIISAKSPSSADQHRSKNEAGLSSTFSRSIAAGCRYIMAPHFRSVSAMESLLACDITCGLPSRK